MKRFSDLSIEEFGNIVAHSESLCKALYSRIETSEMLFLEEKLQKVCDGLSDWCVGPFDANYLHVDDALLFLQGVNNSIASYGSSCRLTKAVEHCSKLENTNLFRWHVKKLSELYLQEELQPICDFISRCYDETHGYSTFGENIDTYLDLFQDDIEDYIYDEENKCYYAPTHIEVA